MAVAQYFTPTHVYFGKDCELEIGKVLKEGGYKNVLIHYGSGSVVRSGLLKKVEDSLSEQKINFVELGGAQPNPRLSLVRKGIELGRQEKIDLIMAVGGGSAIDSAKAISVGIPYNKDVWNFYVGKDSPADRVPLAVVLTLSATGSEMSNSSVITNDEVNPYDKYGLNSDYIKAVYAFMNPVNTFTVSKYQTGSGSADIMMHTLERYFHSGYGLPFTDENAATLLKSVIANTAKALENPEDYDARANLMWAGSVSHNDFTGACNATRGDWACHKLEHELSALYDVAHGAGLAAIWASWARYVCSTDYGRFAKLGKAVFEINEKDEKTAAFKTIDAFEKTFADMGMPVNLHQLGLDLAEADISLLADKATLKDKIALGDFRKLNRDDVYEIYKAANN